MKTGNSSNVTKLRWSQPMGLKGLSQIFDVHRNTMSKWLKDQIIRNQQLSPRRWRVASYEMPDNLTPNDFD
jgi:hypothetical protein